MAFSAPVIRAFSQPAFTYVVKFPYENWKDDEHLLWSLLAPGTERLMIQLRNCAPHPEDDPVREDILCSLADQHYGAIFAKACYIATTTLMGQKQRTPFPRCDIICQSEIGSEHLHCHILVGGAGLSKRNAKISRATLLGLVMAELTQRCKQLLALRPFEPAEANIFHLLKRIEREAWSGHTGNWVQILQYKDKRGDLHAQPIDPLRFLKHYILPKNRLISPSSKPDVCTTPDNWFILADKTYVHTIINGLPLLEHNRKAYLQELESEVIPGPSTMAFGGRGAWEQLPEVGEQRLITSTASTAYKANKKEKLMLNLLDKCDELNLLVYEDLVSACPDLLLMLEGQPGGARLIEQVLGMHHIKVCAKHTALTFLFHLHPDQLLTSSNKALKLLLIQGYNPLQVGHAICCVLNKQMGKQNTICFYGPASTGKTNFAKAIVQGVRLYGCVNHLNKGFVFNDCRQRLIIWWEECLMHQDWVEPAKCILGGTECRIDVKHKDSVLLQQTPVIISTNHDIYSVVGGNTVSHVHAAPLKERVLQLNFMKQLPQTFGEISPVEIAELLQWCFNEYECTLTGFKQKWNLDKVPNSFPLGDLCPTHSQDYTLHENGFCTDCGGYLPHSADDFVYTDVASETTSGDCAPGRL
nr:non-structural protein NS1 [Human bocavirus]